MRRPLPLFFLMVFAVACSGCGGAASDVPIPKLGQVKGTVTWNGTPLADAMVVFEPPAISNDSRESRAMTGPDGKYELVYVGDVKGAVLGRHTVRISKIGENEESVVPKQYNIETTLSADVQAGENTFDFKLVNP